MIKRRFKYLKNEGIFLLIVLFLTISFSYAYASEKTIIKVDVPNFPIVINDNLIDNEKTEYPMLIYKDITYLPMTYFGNRYVGLNMKIYSNKNVIFVGTGMITENKYFHYKLSSDNSETLYAEVIDSKIAINTTDPKHFFQNTIEPYPFLLFRGITYLPLTYHIVVDELDWKISFDSSNGLSIDTKNPNRPIIDSKKIGDSSPQRGSGRLQYVYSDEAYAGFPQSTLNGNYTFKFKIKGDTEEEFILFDELSDGDYWFNYSINDDNDDIVYITDPEYAAALEDNILTVYCVRYSGQSPNYQGENVLLVIDMKNGKILKKEALSN